MARSGGFATSTNPFGSGSLGNLGQYNIGADLADLEVYKVEVAWGNGLATDAEYTAALTKALNATDPDTQRRESAQNKLDDAVYRIGRSKAQEQGLDATIAYDQAAVGKMKPDNVRFRDVSDTLDSELAQRRSRDYGKLVQDYNAGKTSTQSLLSWVKNTLGAIKPDDPDYDNWQGTEQDLTDRIAGEKDSKVYQDFQQGRMHSGPFLEYIQHRRDSFDHSSPDYADWNRRLEDARKQVNDANQAKKDTAFFGSYEEGHKSDAQYLGYLRARINGMKADDPDRASWQHRLNQAAFSLAEDKLRFDVEHRKKPVSSLVSFYRGYRATLNPGSAEWRTITRALDSLHAGTGRGGGSSSAKSKGKGTATGAVTTKAIPTYNMAGVFALMTINPHASKKDQKAAGEFFDLNYTSLENARQRGDNVWLFYDPRKPGAVVQAKNPDGSPALDRNGKPIMVRGSAYIAVSDDAFGQMNVLKANYQFSLAELALAARDPSKYADHLRQGLNAQDKARLVNSQSIQSAFDKFYGAAQDGIDSALRRGDYATALNLSTDVAQRLSAEMQNPQLDETRRDKLDRLGEKLAANPLIPKIDPVSKQQIGGAIDLAGSSKDASGQFSAVALNPGWHHVLDNVDASGAPDWGLAYDQVQDGSWEASHVPVTTSYGRDAVQGEVRRRQAGVNRTVFVPTEDGQIRVDQTVQYLTFTDEHGQVVKAYSIDGQHWIRSLSGTPPQIEVAGNLRNAQDGSGILGEDGKLVFKANDPGNKAAGYKFVGDPSALSWYGTADRQADQDSRAHLTGKQRDDLSAGPGLGLRVAQRSLGAPGQQMQLLTAGSDGSLTFLSDRQLDDQERTLLGTRGGPGTTKSRGNPATPAAFVRPGPTHNTAALPSDKLGQAGKTIAGMLLPWVDTSGIIAAGLGLGARQSPPPHLIGTPAGVRRPDPTEPPALRAVLPPALKLGAKTKVTLPSIGKLKDDLVLPTVPKPRPKPATAPKPPPRPAPIAGPRNRAS